MAEIKLAIYKTPAQAKKIGLTMTIPSSISESEARDIRDYYKSVDEGAGLTYSIFVGVMVAIITKNLKDVFQIGSGAAAGLFSEKTFKSYYGKMENKFDMITNDDPKECEVTYKYKRHGSNDGAYWITDIKVL